MSVFARIVATVALALTGSLAASAAFASDIYGRAVVPAFEVNTIVRSMGFDPTGAPVLRGPVYVIRALDDDDIPLRITVDARSGRVLTVTELAPDDPYNTPGRIGSYPIPPGRVASVPEYRPAPTYGAPRPPNAAQAPVRQSAVAPRLPTPRARPAQTAAPETTASIPNASTTPGKSIPAPVARSAAAPATSAPAPANASEAAPKAAAPNAAAAKTETLMVPVAPLE